MYKGYPMKVKAKNYAYLDDLYIGKYKTIRWTSCFLFQTFENQGKYRLLAGRLGVSMAVMMFVACYIYSISAYGFSLTIAIAWLPSGVIAWLTAFLMTNLIMFFLGMWNHFLKTISTDI